VKFKVVIDTDVVLKISQIRAVFSGGGLVVMRVRSIQKELVSKAIVHNVYAINPTRCRTYRGLLWSTVLSMCLFPRGEHADNDSIKYRSVYIVLYGNYN
jgi:hypothetical protein